MIACSWVDERMVRNQVCPPLWKSGLGGFAVQIPQPPLTWIFPPLMYRASSDNRKRTAATASSSEPTYPAGIFLRTDCSSASGALPEAMNPGEIALTVIP